MRKVFVASLAILLSHAADAADKGAPAPAASLDQIIAMPAPGVALSGAHLEASASGSFLATGSRLATGGIGIGYTARPTDLLILGATLRADWGDSTTGSLSGRLGLAVNANLALYGLATWRVDDWKIDRRGQLAVGAGIETTLFRSDLSAFVEGDVAVSKWGSATKDDIAVRTGLRWYLK